MLWLGISLSKFYDWRNRYGKVNEHFFVKGVIALAAIELKRQGPCRVFALDHGGRNRNPPVEVPIERTPDGWRFTLDGAAYKTPYYVAEFWAP